MRRIVCCLILMMLASVVCHAQLRFHAWPSPPSPIYTNLTISEGVGRIAPVEPEPMILIEETGDKLIEVFDKSGKSILIAYRDGYVEVADYSKINAAAREFWQLLAAYAPLCDEKR